MVWRRVVASTTRRYSSMEATPASEMAGPPRSGRTLPIVGGVVRVVAAPGWDPNRRWCCSLSAARSGCPRQRGSRGPKSNGEVTRRPYGRESREEVKSSPPFTAEPYKVPAPGYVAPRTSLGRTQLVRRYGLNLA